MWDLVNATEEANFFKVRLIQDIKVGFITSDSSSAEEIAKELMAFENSYKHHQLGELDKYKAGYEALTEKDYAELNALLKKNTQRTKASKLNMLRKNGHK
ncbi:hypothetical protein [Burkholderia contaminans]|uniref:hypothetical protein n=1 Tax=Burkholderia contaminans TaxID=488447 RepID=UPI001589F6A0|nr:hypothetical protein [Burkholderia contaminans]